MVRKDEATCEFIRGRTNVSLGGSRCIEHDEDQRIRDVGGSGSVTVVGVQLRCMCPCCALFRSLYRFALALGISHYVAQVSEIIFIYRES